MKIIIVHADTVFRENIADLFSLEPQIFTSVITIDSTTIDTIDELLNQLREQKPNVMLIQDALFLKHNKELITEENKFPNRHFATEITPLLTLDEVLSQSVIIFLSNNLDHHSQVMARGADDIVFTPFSANNLINRVIARFQRLDLVKLNSHTFEYQLKTQVEHHVFISYSRSDTFFMTKVVNDLSIGGLICWTDENLEPGTPQWVQQIQVAIEHSGSMIVLMSPDAKMSVWVNREINYALEHGVRIFPVLIEGTIQQSAPLQLIDAQLSILTEDYTPNIALLIKAIRKHVGIIG